MHFGLHGALETFQRLADQILQSHSQYAATYLDDVAGIYSRNWQDHLKHVMAMLQSLQEAGLTANPAECHLGKDETTCLGYTLGKGTVRPLVNKVQALQTCHAPSLRKQVHQFLGLAWFLLLIYSGFLNRCGPSHLSALEQQPKHDPVDQSL